MHTSLQCTTDPPRRRSEAAATPWRHFATPLIGREAALARLRARLTDAEIRMTTVTGPVGVGKSRLAAATLHAAHEEAGWGIGCTRFLELRPSGSARQLEHALHTACAAGGADLGAPADEPPATMFLLALDCPDGVPRDLPALLTEVLAARPDVEVLVAAPEPLGVYGEEVLRLAPLAVPAEHDASAAPEELAAIASVELLLRRVRAARPDFALRADNRRAVARLCARTDGLPLAIEFAAARMKLRSPDEVLAELDHGLDALSGGSGDTLSRHDGMRAAIAGSLAPLRHDDRELLGRIAVFRGAVGLAEVAGVAERIPGAEVQHGIERLVDRNVLQTVEDGNGGLAFRMLGLTHQYVLETMGSDGGRDRAKRAHAEHFLSVAAGRQLPGGGAGGGPAAELRRWGPDARAALAYLADTGDHAGVVHLACALHPFWDSVVSAEQTLAAAQRDSDLPPLLALDGECVLAELLMWEGRYGEAQERLERAQAGCDAVGDEARAAGALRRAGVLAVHRGDVRRGERLLRESSAVRVEGAGAERAAALRTLADCLLARYGTEAADDARAAAEEAVGLSQAAPDPHGAALADTVLADALFESGREDEAEERHRQALLRLHDLGDRIAVADALDRKAVLWHRRCGIGTPFLRRAVLVAGAASALRASVGCRPPLPLARAVEAALEGARVRLGVQAYEGAWAAGRGLSPQTAAAEAVVPAPDPLAELRMRRDNPLTERELQVAELVAQGITNREIARRLDIAEWTAINHLRKVMRKLDCSSRVAVASWYTRLAPERPADAAPRPADGGHAPPEQDAPTQAGGPLR